MRSMLRPTVTRVTQMDGSVTLEQGDTIVSVSPTDHSSPGYIVDTSPDLGVARILPWLHMSSQDVAAHQQLLQDHGITHILNVGSGIDIHRDSWSWRVEERRVEMLDIPEQSIDKAMAESFEYLELCHESGANVLVHCNAGVSRSATVVIGYLMEHHNMTYDQAHQVVKTKRPCIRPNEGFVTQLKERDKS